MKHLGSQVGTCCVYYLSLLSKTEPRKACGRCRVPSSGGFFIVLARLSPRSSYSTVNNQGRKGRRASIHPLDICAISKRCICPAIRKRCRLFRKEFW